MEKKPLWKDILVLLGTVLAAAELFLLPPVPVLRWNGEVVFQIGKYYGILLGYVLLFVGLWLPDLLSSHFRRAGKYVLYGAGYVLAFAGLILLTGFLLQNEIALEKSVLLIILLCLIPFVHGIAQYLLCRYGKNTLVRCIPVYICLLELLLTANVFYDPFDLYSGWDALAGMFTAVLTVPPSGAVLLAWIVWWVESAVRRRKQITE